MTTHINSSAGRTAVLAAACALLAAGACESDDPKPTGPMAPATPSMVATDALCAADEGIAALEAPSCPSSPMDYTPRVAMSTTDAWPACVSDGNVYVRFKDTIGSLNRVAAFDEIAQRLGFGTTKVPTAEDFFEAQKAYSVAEGIESRVGRREDDHFPALPKACRDMTPEEQLAHVDRCVGPAQIKPIVEAAFIEGKAGREPMRNAARLEAALIWFFYASTYKEATSAAGNAPDVDSMWAKYSGGEARDSATPKGLSRYVRARSLGAHDRIYDGLLAVRCWRDLDNPTGAAMNTELHARARAQLDRALLRGVALIVRQRAARLPCAPAWESVKILGKVLLREARVRDGAKAAELEAEIVKNDVTKVDKAKLERALDALFPCP